MTIKFQAKHKNGFTIDGPLHAFTFPAGEAHIKVDDNANFDDYEYFIADIRGHNPQDLFMASMWQQFLWENQKKSVLLLPYLPAARADRGTPNLWSYSKFVSELIMPDLLITLDPHSPAWLDFYQHNNPFDTIIFPFERIIKREVQDASSDEKGMPYVGVIAPDKGAHDRAAAAARVMGVPVYTAGKTRNFETGKLTGFHMEDALPDEGTFLIVDDICDGGGTFLGLAGAIKETNPNVKLDLWVTHGVFSQGVSKLLDTFGTVHTTNSYFGAHGSDYLTGVHAREGARLITHDITPYLYSEASNNV